MLKNLDTLNAEEMRTMLKNISAILETNYGDRTLEAQTEFIGLEFFAEGMDRKAYHSFDDLVKLINGAESRYLLNLIDKNIQQWHQLYNVDQILTLRNLVQKKRPLVNSSY